jgi:signal peptidase I
MTGTATAPACKSAMTMLREVAIVVVLALVIAFVVKTFLVRSFFIPSGSMEQTLQVNDRILVDELGPKLAGVHRGDVVVFRDPGGWLDRGSEYLVKRVIGIGGDRVRCCDAAGRVTVNGIRLNEPYAVIPAGESRASGIDFDVTVPDGSLWVMGDNRYHSQDSRFHQDEPGNGFVDEGEVIGRAFVIASPLRRVTWLGS